MLPSSQCRMAQSSRPELQERYAYYRRCQVFRRNGEQCKAPAEKGAHICHAHAGQAETERRRAEQRRELLSRPGLGFGDFKSIQRTIAAMAQALIDGRIDCKTAGRLAVELQTWSKLLWMVHRKGREDRKENQISPQISADERRLNKREELPGLFVLPRALEVNAGRNWAANQREKARIALGVEVVVFADGRGCRHGPPEWAKAA